MERHEILEMMAELKLLGMRLAFDEVLTTGVKRQHPAQQIIGDLLAAEIAGAQVHTSRASRDPRVRAQTPRASCRR